MCHGSIIDTDHLPDRFFETIPRLEHDTEAATSEDPLKHAEKVAIIQTLEKYKGHRGKTADALSIDKTTLWRKMKKYELI